MDYRNSNVKIKVRSIFFFSRLVCRQTVEFHNRESLKDIDNFNILCARLCLQGEWKHGSLQFIKRSCSNGKDLCYVLSSLRPRSQFLARSSYVTTYMLFMLMVMPITILIRYNNTHNLSTANQVQSNRTKYYPNQI